MRMGIPSSAMSWSEENDRAGRGDRQSDDDRREAPGRAGASARVERPRMERGTFETLRAQPARQDGSPYGFSSSKTGSTRSITVDSHMVAAILSGIADLSNRLMDRREPGTPEWPHRLTTPPARAQAVQSRDGPRPHA